MVARFEPKFLRSCLPGRPVSVINAHFIHARGPQRI
jgi:hypothetical protein